MLETKFIIQKDSILLNPSVTGIIYVNLYSSNMISQNMKYVSE